MSHDACKAARVHDGLHQAHLRLDDPQLLRRLQNNALGRPLATGDPPFFANVNQGDNIDINGNDPANNQNQQQWCQKSVITQDTMSDISKLNLTSLSVINKQANEQDGQAAMERQVGEYSNMDNVSQMKKLKLAQERKQGGRQQVQASNFQQKYRLMQQTWDYQQTRQVAEAGPQQTRAVAPNAQAPGHYPAQGNPGHGATAQGALWKPPDSQGGGLAAGQNERERSSQLQDASRAQSSLMDIQNQEGQPLERNWPPSANVDASHG